MAGVESRVFATQMTVFGVANWRGPKYLEFFQRGNQPDAPGAPGDHGVSEVWLGHAGLPTATVPRPTILVATFAPDTIGIPLEQRVVFGGAMQAGALSIPGPDTERPRELHQPLADHVHAAVANRTAWPTTALSIEGSAVECRHWTFAYWTVVYCPPADRHPFVVVTNSPHLLAEIDLQPLTNTDEYGFDLRNGFTLADADPTDEAPTELHDDFRRTLAT
jgi:hypothetical protein